ncbi:MAG TPA: tetratricopeptide repeat protein, partial [Deferrisomatales bacterium]|nr:tetratricopeptide repeat protein [Deferrisomatales bacterium]
MRFWPAPCPWAAPVVVSAALALAGCAGAPVPQPEPAQVGQPPSAPLGEVTGSRSFGEVLEEARRALGRKDYQEAARVAREAGRLALDPGAARLLEAEARQAMGDGAGALPLWQAAVEAGPDRPRVWAAYAELAVHRGAGDEALALFDQRFAALSGGEGPDPTLSGVAGWTALAAGRGERATAYLAATVGTPAEGAFAVALGRAQLLVGALADAAEAARRAVAGSVGGEATAQGWLLLGDVRREQGMAAGARDAYEKVLEVDPANYAARVNLAVLTLQQGDAEAAIALLQVATESRPGAPEAWH